MNWKQRIVNWAFKNHSISSSIGFLTQGFSAIWSKINPQSLINVGYKSNVIVFRCISLISRAAARVPLVVFRGSEDKRGEKIDNHWLVDLVNNPNPKTDKTMLIEAVLSFQQITGNAFLEAVTIDSDRRISELWVLPSQHMTIRHQNSAMPTAYELHVNGKKIVFPIDMNGKSDIVQFRYFNPNDMFLGMSPMEPALKSVDQHNKSGEFNAALLDNQATPSGAFIYSPKNGTDILQDKQFNRLKKEMAENMQGTSNAGIPLVLDGGLDWKQMGLSPVTDLGLIPSKRMTANEIAMAYHVPVNFVGDTTASTFNNIAEAKLELYEQAVLPNLEQFCRVMTKFAKMFDPGDWFLWYDEDAIEALEPRRAIKFDRAVKGIAGALLSPNEGREMIGRAKVKGGEDVFITSSLLPLSFEPTQDENE